MSIVKIKTRDTLSTGVGTIITTEDGVPIRGVRKATVHIEMDRAITAELEVFATWAGQALSRFVVKDPLTGEVKAVKRIEFLDGSSFDAEAVVPIKTTDCE